MAYTFHYYDPGAPLNGTGTSFRSPRNTLSGLTVGGASVAILFKAGSVRNTQVTVSSSGGVGTEFILGVYDPETGAMVTDGSQRAVIDGLGVAQFGIIGNASIANVKVIGFELMNFGGASCAGIAHSSTGGTNWQISQCVIHDVVCTVSNGGSGITMPNTTSEIRFCHIYNIFGENALGIRLAGGAAIVEDCVIHDIAADGIQFTREAKIRRCRIYNVGLDEVTATGDCIQGAGTLGQFEIIDCFLDHRQSNQKQTVIIEESGGTFGGRIIGNTMLGARQYLPAKSSTHKTLYVDQPYCKVIGNYVTEGERGINIQDTATNCIVTGNVVIQTYRGSLIGIRQGGGDGNLIANNTVINTDGREGECVGILQPAASPTGTDCCNNIIQGYKYGIMADLATAAAVHNNCINECEFPLVNEAGAPQALDSSSTTANPCLNERFEISAGSPCRRAGTPLPILRDFFRKSILGLPDMGAKQYYPARPLAERRATTA